jgi:hypothetical protein
MQRSLRCVSFLLSLLVAVPVVAETGKPVSPAISTPEKSAMDLGLIFNAPLFPLDLQPYQAGIGIKFGQGAWHLRGLLDFVVSGASDSLALNLGATMEYHLTPEPLSFYFGGSCVGGYMRQGGSFSAIVVSVGAIAGVEYFPLKFLSLFAEYALITDLSWTTDLSSSLTTFDYLIDTRMGNDSKIGIVIHLLRLMGK